MKSPAAINKNEVASCTEIQSLPGTDCINNGRRLEKKVTGYQRTLADIEFAGAKTQSGLYQWIINLIPWHMVYVEPFAGTGAIYRKKKTATRSLLVDKDISYIFNLPSIQFIEGCGIEVLECRSNFYDDSRTFIYCDPPYVLSTRENRKYYKHEMSDEDHIRFLNVARSLKCNILISGYWSEMYSHLLSDWNCESKIVKNRMNQEREEFVWFNYDKPAVPFDLQFIGDNSRDRWNLKQKAKRWKSRLMKLSAAEREFILQELQN